MKKSDKIIICIISVLIILAVIPAGIKYIPDWFEEKPTSNIISAKTPFKAKLSSPDKSVINFYTEKSGDKYRFARNPWDMKTYDNKVYICFGDYDRNSGDTPIFCYNPDKNKFSYAGIVYSEQASKFYEFDEKLYTTAIDPVAWGVGEFYVKNPQKDSFDYCEALPSNIHCFDMAEFDNKMFFCGSVTDYKNYSMIQYIEKEDMPANDCYKTKQIFLYKDGKKVSTEYTYRVYELISYKGNLYAWHLSYSYDNGYTGLYVYNKEKCRFDYIEGEKSINNVTALKNKDMDFMFTLEKLIFKEKQVFVNYDLFYTDDLKNYTVCELGKEFSDYDVRDAVEIEGQLYVLANKKQSDGSYTNSVLVTDDLKSFGEVLYFETQSYITSFEYVNKTFVFGEGGTYNNTAESCGNLYTCMVE